MDEVSTFIWPVQYRGTRSYVHAADLYGALEQMPARFGLGEITGHIRLDLRRAMRRRPQFHVIAPGRPVNPDPQAPAGFSIGLRQGTLAGWITESDEPVDGSKPYDEGAIWSRATVEGETSLLRGDTAARPIEVVTALGVLHHKTLFPPPEGLRWMCVRLDFERPLSEADAFDAQLRMTNVAARKFTKSAITLRGKRNGDIYFILGSPSAR